jgi:L-lactate dehydrogenase (cytochrome)
MRISRRELGCILPAAIADAVGSRTTVMIDSGIRSGLDVLRVLALGARAAFAGRPFLYGLGALGEVGARFVMDLFVDELRTEMQHVGIQTVRDAHSITVRHPGAWSNVE